MPEIRYALAMRRPRSHLFAVAVEVRDMEGEYIDLVMPVWTPGSYKVRDYARNVQDFEAPGRRWGKTAKHRWRVFTAGARRVTARYRVYANELNVRGLHLDDEHAYVNGAAVFMYVDGAKHVPVTVDVRPPRGWRIVSGLERLSSGVLQAGDYDVLVDSPIECGRFDLQVWRQFGREHRLAVHGPVNRDRRELVRDIRKIIAAEAGIFDGVPYRDYTFILHTLTQDGGGLEHLNSTSLQHPAQAFAKRDRYERFLQLVAHEFFHLWNVKRIHPVGLGPFDYERETYTGLLWVMEGFTSYYEILALRRAKLVSVKGTFKALAERIQQYLDKPGRRHQSLSESSFDTWIKFYNPNEHTPNAQVSYYEKGSLVALCMDLEIRARTRNRRSLDDVLRALWEAYGRRGVGFPEPEFKRAVERAAGSTFDEFWWDYVDGTVEIDFDAFLRHAGCRLVRKPKREDDRELPVRKTWLGIIAGRAGDRVLVTSVRAGSPAEKGGLCARDEILAIDGLRVGPDDWEKRIEERRPGQRARVSLLRGPFLREVDVVLGEREDVTVSVEAVRKPTALQRAIYQSWMGEALRAGR
ncbi:MAG: M61 family metallopeptidase [Planctomycetes bacterium]|nr:M61 family metallopeptidase [Planctomycetota bacterium]